MRLGASRALLRSVVKDGYRLARRLTGFLQLDLPAGSVVDRSLQVDNPRRIQIEKGVSIAAGVSLSCAPEASIILRRGVVLAQGVMLVAEGTGVIELGPEVSLGRHVRMRTSNRITLGAKTMIMEASSIEPREADECGVFEVGENSTVHAYNWLDTTGDIRIGSETNTGPFSLFYTHNHRYDRPGSIWTQGIRIEPIVFGNGIWMGSKVIVMPGVVVGDGTVIAAASILTKHYGSDEIVLGIPAATLRKRHGV